MTEPDPASEPIPYKPPSKPEHVHVWNILDVWQPSTQGYHPRIAPTDMTVVLIRCRTCELPQTIELRGIWTLEQILKNHARIER
jgi:hypothetical protein